MVALPAAPLHEPRVSPQLEPQPVPMADRNRQSQNFTIYQRGDLPIILTAPHGGVKRIPDIPNRTGEGVAMFVTVLDDGTLELAQEVSDALFALLGARPYLVVADFTRKQIDANRSRDGRERGVEVVAARPYYDFYHGKIREYIDAVKKQFGQRAILVDIHGQGVDAKTVYRGTQNRQTVRALLARNAEASLTGPNSILGVLEQKGNIIFPRNNDLLTPEHRIFAGGYTVRHYGSNNQNGIDALQLENGWVLRREGRARFAQELAQAIAQFYLNYLVQ